MRATEIQSRHLFKTFCFRTFVFLNYKRFHGSFSNRNALPKIVFIAGFLSNFKD